MFFPPGGMRFMGVVYQDAMFWAGSAVLIAGLAVLIIFYLKHRRRHAGFIALETTNTAQERPV